MPRLHSTVSWPAGLLLFAAVGCAQPPDDTASADCATDNGGKVGTGGTTTDSAESDLATVGDSIPTEEGPAATAAYGTDSIILRAFGCKRTGADLVCALTMTPMDGDWDLTLGVRGNPGICGETIAYDDLGNQFTPVDAQLGNQSLAAGCIIRTIIGDVATKYLFRLPEVSSAATSLSAITVSINGRRVSDRYALNAAPKLIDVPILP